MSFQITKYLQYRNAPDGKPRVLTEGKDYLIKTSTQLLTLENMQLPIVSFEGWNGISSEFIADLKDCKELLTITLQGTGNHDFVWTDGDVFEYQYNGKFIFSLPEILDSFLFDYSPDTSNFDTSNKRIGSFFDDPAKYSQLLWNCCEQEGWEKIFKLLQIKL